MATEVTGTTTDVITPTAAAVADSTPSVSLEDKVEDNYLQDEDEKPVKFGKIVDPHVLGCCEFCGGPVKRRRFCSPLKRFCSKGCSRSSRRANLKVCDYIMIHFLCDSKCLSVEITLFIQSLL